MTGHVSAPVDVPLLVHSAERQSLWSEATRELRGLVAHHELLRYMVMNALRATYDGTFFGYLWWLLDPMLNTAVYLFMVHIVLRQGGSDYALYIATSLVVWKFFSSAARNAIGMMSARAMLIRQVSFPRSVLPLAAVLAETIRFGFGVVAVLFFGTFFGVGIDPGTLWALLPIGAVVMIFALGLGFLLSALNILFRDTYTLTQYWFQLWFYLSPGLYVLAQIPEHYRGVYMANPFATLLPATHSVILDHELPHFGALGIVTAAALALLVVGFLVFVRLERLFAKLQ